MNIRDFFDWFWPTLEKEPENYNKRIEKRKNDLLPQWSKESSECFIESFYSILKDRIDNENERQRSFDSRLQTMLSLTSVCITIILGVMGFFIRSVSNSMNITLYVILMMIIYILIQFALAIFHAVEGLNLKNYISCDQIVPNKEENQNIFLKRLIEKMTEAYVYNVEKNNEKGSSLNLCNVCLRNASTGLIIIAAILIFIA